MSKWCDICYRNEITGEWEPCDESCPVFGRCFGELAHHVISHELDEIKRYVREYAEDKIKSLEEDYAVRRNESAKKVIDEIKKKRSGVFATQKKELVLNYEHNTGIWALRRL